VSYGSVDRHHRGFLATRRKSRCAFSYVDRCQRTIASTILKDLLLALGPDLGPACSLASGAVFQRTLDDVCYHT